MAQTFLQLPPEMGGTRFGPFNGPIQLGSDPAKCQVTLPANLGIQPVHAVVGPNGDGSYTLAPTVQGAQVFLLQQATQQLWPVTGPVRAGIGDSVVLGSAQGPRFQLQSGPSAPPPGLAPGMAAVAAQGGGYQGALASGPTDAAPAAARPSGPGIGARIADMFDAALGNQSTGNRITDELLRQQRAKLMRKSPYREIYAFSHLLRSGQLFGPTVVVGLITAVLGAILVGGLSCTGIFTAVLYQLRL